MKRNRNKLVVLTLDEGAFLETEIIYLAQNFKQVFLIPSETLDENSVNINSKPSSLPSNVTVIKDLAHNKVRFAVKNLRGNLWYLLKVYSYSLIHSRRRFKYFKHIKSLVHYFFLDASKRRLLAKIIKVYHLEDAVFYDYWLLNSSLALISLKKSGLIDNAVCRAHSFDLYDYRHFENVVPFKEYKIRHLNEISTVSTHGEEYLKRQVHQSLHSKIRTFRLGTAGLQKIPDIGSSNIIVSCSRLIDFKRIDRIVESLKLIKIDIEWVHFGDGPEEGLIREIIGDLPENIKVKLCGDVLNEEIIDFYTNNFVSAFITLSSIEGLPVSLMEAISFGIPLIAPRVNGIPEIVTNETGILLEEGFSNEDVASAIDFLVSSKNSYDRNRVLAFFNEHFNAEKNYNRFINEMLLKV